MKLFFIFLCLIWWNRFSSQQKEIDQALHYLDKSNEFSGIDNLKSLEYAKKASLIAEKINHSEKKAESYLFIAKCLYVLDSYKESLEYIQKGQKEDAVKNDVVLACSFKEVLALDYFATGFEEQGLKEYFDIINLIKSNTDEESIRILSRTYATVGAIYLNQNNYKAGHPFLDKAIKTNMKVSVKGHIFERADLYNIKGYLCLYDQKTDSAYIYFKKSFAEIEKDNSISKYVQYIALGDYYYQIKDYNNALNYYLKTLEDLKKFNLDKNESSLDIFKNISEIYGILKNSEKEKEYLKEYQKRNEIFQKERKEDFQASIKSILNTKTEEISFLRKRGTQTIIAIIAVAILIIILINRRSKKINKIKKKALLEAKTELIAQKEIIIQKDDEKRRLEHRINDAFDEVIELARKNDPSFLTRFKEVYPDFCENLLEIYPDMLNSELTFCAYLKLNFTSKEIANYTFVTPKAVELRKNRFRKKMNIASDENLYVWIGNI
ncbi:tetratricopeptide repeat protein [Epilithonimonas xixisoli]|uniref:Uncharacterized protein n=1 Tax=Epilithonimonas xixisoli TaxID=1476462 RepID=A0A4R8IEQ6_9FLAO|nr:tetratricopeptide repeat protein [Epilithonimonas xixisoli]TDX86946.1 hypothetical protein B0I22_1109 [Epilithonimonas xixisoli]